MTNKRTDVTVDFDANDPATEGLAEVAEVDDVASLVDPDQALKARIAELLDQRIPTHNMLVALRSAVGLTQEQVADAWGRAQPHVSRIERGELTKLPLRSLAEYVDALGGSMRVVFELYGARIEVSCLPTGALTVDPTLPATSFGGCASKPSGPAAPDRSASVD